MISLDFDQTDVPADSGIPTNIVVLGIGFDGAMAVPDVHAPSGVMLRRVACGRADFALEHAHHATRVLLPDEFGQAEAGAGATAPESLRKAVRDADLVLVLAELSPWNAGAAAEVVACCKAEAAHLVVACSLEPEHEYVDGRFGTPKRGIARILEHAHLVVLPIDAFARPLRSPDGLRHPAFYGVDGLVACAQFLISALATEGTSMDLLDLLMRSGNTPRLWALSEGVGATALEALRRAIRPSAWDCLRLRAENEPSPAAFFHLVSNDPGLKLTEYADACEYLKQVVEGQVDLYAEISLDPTSAFRAKVGLLMQASGPAAATVLGDLAPAPAGAR